MIGCRHSKVTSAWFSNMWNHVGLMSLNLTKEILFSFGIYISDFLIVFQNLLWWGKSSTAGGFLVRKLKWFVIFGLFFCFSFSFCCFFPEHEYLLGFCLFVFSSGASEYQTNFLSQSLVGFRCQALKSAAPFFSGNLKTHCLVAFLSPATLLLSYPRVF